MTAGLAGELAALRTATALAPGDHVAAIRIRGAGGTDLLDRVSPRTLYARPGRMSHTMFLADDARPIADVYLCCDEDDHYVLAEGMTASRAIDFLGAHASGLDVTLEDLTGTHAMLCLGGPYAWELLGELTTPDVIGLPYLGFFHTDRFTCFRGGKTGEYGYDLLVERGQLDSVRDQIATIGARFDLATISLDALEVAGLENFFWNARRHAPEGTTPIELQQQWRVTYGRSFPGSSALDARRQTATRRTVMIAGDRELSGAVTIGAANDRVIGEVIDAAASPTRGDWIGLALVDRAYAHAGLEGLGAGDVAIRTVSAPAVDNKSLYIDPQRHSFATRGT